MGSKDEFKKTYIKNCTCYYFDDLMGVTDIDFQDIF